MSSIRAILAQIGVKNKPQEKFLETLIFGWLATQGRKNFRNLSRYIHICEHTISRWFNKDFDFQAYNKVLIDKVLSTNDTKVVLTIDATFIPKSGTKTEGIGKFWSGCDQIAQKGLELSTLAFVSVGPRKAIAFDAEQTFLDGSEDTRISFYTQQIIKHVEYIQTKTNYIVADGYYAKQKFITSLVNKNFKIITSLRSDADLKFRCPPPQTRKRGRPKKYGEKLDLKTFSNLGTAISKDDTYSYYQCDVYSKTFKMDLRVVVLVSKNRLGKTCSKILASTDLALTALEIIEMYSARFQIEFLFRDAKQHLGLNDCQARDRKKLSFHFKFTMLVLNLAITEQWSDTRFSIQNFKNKYARQNMLNFFISKLELNPEDIKNHPNFQFLIDMGYIAA